MFSCIYTMFLLFASLDDMALPKWGLFLKNLLFQEQVFPFRDDFCLVDDNDNICLI